jgi:hypothetical protein
VQGINRDGTQCAISIDQIDPSPEDGFVSAETSFFPGSKPERGAFFSTKPLPIKFIKPQRTTLGKSIDNQLRDYTKKLWTDHLPERPQEEQPKGFTLGAPIVEQVESEPNFLIVLYPVKTEEKDGSHDNRGSMFFIYSIPDHRIVLAEFGHPEWSPGSSVLIIKPELYFRLEGNSTVYFIGIHQGGWEEWGHAIYELKTGRKVLICY